MRIGIGPFPLEHAPDTPAASPRSLERGYAHALELAELAERVGLDAVWVDGNHFTDVAHGPSPLLMAAALAARTERVTIGTATLTLTLGEHPLIVAEEALVVDALSAGRLVLGIGLGYRESEFRGFGVALDERRARFDAALATLTAAFAEPPGFPLEAGHASVGGAVVPWPRPAASGGPPIWVGGGWSPAAIRRVAGSGLPLISQFFEDNDRIARKVALYREAADPAAPAARCFPVIRDIVLGAAAPAAEVLLPVYRRYAAWGMPVLGRPCNPEEIRADDVYEIAVLGSEDEIRQRLERLRSAGASEVLARVDLPGIAPETAENTVRALGRIRRHLEGVCGDSPGT